MCMPSQENLVQLLIPRIYYKAEFNHGCETLASLFIKACQWLVIKAQTVGLNKFLD